MAEHLDHPHIAQQLLDQQKQINDLAAERDMLRRNLQRALTETQIVTARANLALTYHDRASQYRAAWHSARRRAQGRIHAEATIARVRAVLADWLSTGAPRLGTSINRWWDKRLIELTAALDEPAHTLIEEQLDHARQELGAPMTHITTTDPMTQAQYEALRAEWLKTHGNSQNGRAHIIKPLDQDDHHP